MKIILDAMSGDRAPAEIVRGAVLARAETGAEIILVGLEGRLRAELEARGAAGDPGISVANATEVIDMHDDPSTAVRRKKDSSMAVALELLRDGAGDAVVSAGNTGALLTGATLTVKRIRGIRRACMAPVLPVGQYGALLIDCGANADCTPEYLLQFAFMGSFYSRRLLGCPEPRVGLLSNGTEEGKGAALQKETYPLLRRAAGAGRINFVGNVEASDVFADRVEVVVADGFTGNVMLKTVEGTAKFLMKQLKATMMGSVKNKIAAAMLKRDLAGLKKLLDPNEVGGTPFLGIRQPVFKAHGSSDGAAIAAAVRQAKAFVEAGVIAEIENNIGDMRLRDSEDSEE